MFSLLSVAQAVGAQCFSMLREVHQVRRAVRSGSALVSWEEKPLTIHALIARVAEIAAVEVVVDYESVLPHDVDGFTCVVEGRALIAISETSLQPDFTLLHELAHLALGHCSTLGHTCDAALEAQANALASRWGALIQTGDLRRDIALVFS